MKKLDLPTTLGIYMTPTASHSTQSETICTLKDLTRDTAINRYLYQGEIKMNISDYNVTTHEKQIEEIGYRRLDSRQTLIYLLHVLIRSDGLKIGVGDASGRALGIEYLDEMHETINCIYPDCL